MALQQSDQLKNWTATLADKLTADKTSRRFQISTIPEFKCVLCENEIVSSPVFQCQLGHLACSRCSSRGRCCTFCNKAVSRIKNVAIGAMIDSIYVTCKFESLGCKNTCQLKSYADHEKTCAFTPITCPMPDCKQAGVTNSLKEHLKKHGVSALVEISSHSYFSYPGSASFSLDSIPTKVLLKHFGTRDFYLLHQVTTDIGDRLYVTALNESCKLKRYEINVEVTFFPENNIEIKNSFKFKSRSNTFEETSLFIPKVLEPGTAPSKVCTIRFFNS